MESIVYVAMVYVVCFVFMLCIHSPPHPHHTSPAHIPSSLKTTQIMATPVVGLSEVESVEHILQVLRDTTHQGFPVYALEPTLPSSTSLSGTSPPSPSHPPHPIDGLGGRLQGIVTRSQLLVLLEAGAFCNAEGRYLQLAGIEDAAAYEARLADMMHAMMAHSRTVTTLAMRWQHRHGSAGGGGAQLGLLMDRRPDVTLPIAAGGQPMHVAWLQHVAGGASLSGRFLNLAPFMHQAPVSIR